MRLWSFYVCDFKEIKNKKLKTFWLCFIDECYLSALIEMKIDENSQL